MTNTEKVLESILSKVKFSEKDFARLQENAEEFCEKLRKIIKTKKILADVFIGGSVAKHTLIKKKKQDIDIFIRFDQKYNETEMSKKFLEICKSVKCKGKKERIHGSRDYYNFYDSSFVFEVVPVLKIDKPELARNTTDLSYFHVEYVLNELKKNAKLADEIILAKTFTYASGCYGAESHIRGFSGYSLELLVIYYKGFLKFVDAILKEKNKLLIDPKKFYKTGEEIMLDVNEAKLESPIVLIDPTFKQRNALASLSIETLEKFRDYCKNFLNNSSEQYFEKKEFNEKEFKILGKKNQAKLLKIELVTDRQEGSVAGSKLLKFFKFISSELSEYYELIDTKFVYSGKKALCYFMIKPKKDLVYSGPPITDVENFVNFKKIHKKVFIKEGKVYAEKKLMKEREILKNIKKKKKIVKSMGIKSIKEMKI